MFEDTPHVHLRLHLKSLKSLSKMGGSRLSVFWLRVFCGFLLVTLIVENAKILEASSIVVKISREY